MCWQLHPPTHSPLLAHAQLQAALERRQLSGQLVLLPHQLISALLQRRRRAPQQRIRLRLCCCGGRGHLGAQRLQLGQRGGSGGGQAALPFRQGGGLTGYSLGGGWDREGVLFIMPS